MKESKIESNSGTEKVNEEAINALKESTPHIIQHGENSQVVNIHHEGDGDILHDSGEIKKLRAQLRLYKKLLEGMETCAEENEKKIIAALQAKDEEIQVLKDTISLLRTNSQ